MGLRPLRLHRAGQRSYDCVKLVYINGLRISVVFQERLSVALEEFWFGHRMLREVKFVFSVIRPQVRWQLQKENCIRLCQKSLMLNSLLGDVYLTYAECIVSYLINLRERRIFLTKLQPAPHS